MELRQGGNNGALIRIEAVVELVSDMLATLPQGLEARQLYDEPIEIFLRYSRVQVKLTPAGTVEGQRAACVFAEQCHREFGRENRQVRFQTRSRAWT